MRHAVEPGQGSVCHETSKQGYFVYQFFISSPPHTASQYAREFLFQIPGIVSLPRTVSHV